MTRASIVVCAVMTACAGAPRPFPLREPLATDTDLRPVSVPCRPDPSPKEPRRVTCAPREYTSSCGSPSLRMTSLMLASLHRSAPSLL